MRHLVGRCFLGVLCVLGGGCSGSHVGVGDAQPDATVGLDAGPPRDDDAGVCRPSAEACNDLDDDCDGRIDEEGASGCVDFAADDDGDGFGAGATRCLCAPSLTHSVRVLGDCDDSNPRAYPFALEVCNGRDDDCDGDSDEEGADGCRSHYGDADGDGFGAAYRVACLCAPSAEYPAVMAGDCDDGNAEKHPSRSEACDAIDNDCDGAVDEGVASTVYADSDADGWGSGPPLDGCTASGAVATRAGDCAEGDAAVHPGASEACNERDDDCDGRVDEGFTGSCAAIDADGDGVLDADDNCPSTPNPGQADLDGDRVGDACDPDQDGDGELDGSDCGPRDASVYPGAMERCNASDDDCDMNVDEGFDVGDACSAGMGACARTGTMICDASLVGTTCSATPLPPAVEACNGTDDDCDGSVDEGRICPDATVSNTLPFTRGVWYTHSTSTCGRQQLLQFWPTFDTTFTYSGFDCYADWWHFRASDATVFYTATFDGIYEHSETSADVLLSTPPCEPREPFGFDGSDRLYYQCATSLRRNMGDLVSSDVSRLLLVFDDGRALVQRSSVLAVLRPDGATATTWDPSAMYAGRLTLLPLAGTSQGNDGFIAFSRELAGSPDEFVILRVDASNAFRQVRRIAIPGGITSTNGLATPDGAFYLMERDSATTFDYQIRRFAPGGTSSVVWREATTTFGVHIDRQMLVGPRR